MLPSLQDGARKSRTLSPDAGEAAPRGPLSGNKVYSGGPAKGNETLHAPSRALGIARIVSNERRIARAWRAPAARDPIVRAFSVRTFMFKKKKRNWLYPLTTSKLDILRQR